MSSIKNYSSINKIKDKKEKNKILPIGARLSISR